MVERRFGIDRICIVESLPPAERLGVDLRDRLVADQVFAIEDIELVPINGREDFGTTLQRLTDEVRDGHGIPLVHLELHGAKPGILFEDGTVARWRDMEELLRNLNVSTRNNLVVVLGSCRSYYLSSILLPTKPSPVFGLVGTTEDVPEVAVRHGFPAFYRVLCAAGDVVAATAELQRHHADYVAMSAEYLFNKAWERYAATDLTDERVAFRTDEMLRQARAEGRVPIEEGTVRTDIRARLVDGASATRQKFRARFLMMDLFPENHDRFAEDPSVSDHSSSGGP